MDFVSLDFYIFLMIVLVLYYAFPLKLRWLILLLASMGFYYFSSPKGMVVLLAIAFVSYVLGLLIDILAYSFLRRIMAAVILLFSVVLVALPLVAVKFSDYVIEHFLKGDTTYWIVPLGLSFFTLQVIAYLVDIFRRKIRAQRNPLKYLLFVSFFPQIIQGPIPRYEQLGEQLFKGHRFDEKKFSKGIMLIMWGFFLKLMLADKAAIIVNTILNSKGYEGFYYWIAILLYCLQLYTDFMACVSCAQGIAELFGIILPANFRQPFFSRSIKEFWGRWHITLGMWFRDYIYIPLGGNRHGVILKYFNISVVFLVSAAWHGTTEEKFLIWGMLQVFYQLMGDLLKRPRKAIYRWLRVRENGFTQTWIQRVGTLFWFLLSLVMFRADSLHDGVYMLKSMFTTFNPWIFFNDSIFSLGLSWKECLVLAGSAIILFNVSLLHERKFEIREWILRQPMAFRWLFYLGTIVAIFVFGTYGFGFSAQDFIYGGF